MADHSILSPSSMERIIACPPSALENAGRPDQESEYAAQGTDAHALCEAKLREYLGEKVRNPREDLTWYDQEMEDCTDDYMTFVAGQIMEARRQETERTAGVKIIRQAGYDIHVEAGKLQEIYLQKAARAYSKTRRQP